MDTANFNNSLNFKSIYRYNVDRSNYDTANSALNKLYILELKSGENKLFSDFHDSAQSLKTGIYETIHISVADEFDDYVESILKQRNINFSKQSHEDAMRIENIYNRIVLPDYRPDWELVDFETDKIERLFKQSCLYISEDKTGADGRFNGVREYFKTGRDIEASQIVLMEENGKLSLDFLDGRHRYCVMRDLGMKNIKFATDSLSKQLAIKYGLIAE